ncbi:MAG: sigma-70 family RNA polymerase sigma factor [Spirochaetia bacterium]|nr:sigma-70 family RNA polymerase sigma factor [Spirochaetia bacterium]
MGEEGELKQLYLETRRPLWGYVRSIVLDPDTAEDIVQTSYMKLIDVLARKGVHPERRIPYLYTIARNECMTHFRRSKREVPVAEAPAVAASDSAPMDRIQTILVTCFSDKRLEERKREVLRLRVMSHMPADDVASVLGISRRTAYRDLEEALQFVKERFLAEGISAEDLG